MNKRMKVLAASTVVGLQALPGYVSVASAQIVNPPVTITATGTSCGSGSVRVFEGGIFRGCTSLSNLPGGGGGSVPEGEAWVDGRWGFAPPPTPPKTEEQRQRERDQCNTDRTWKMQVYAQGAQPLVQACASRYAADNIFTLIETLRSLFGSSCAQDLARDTQAAANKFDDEHKACMAKANGP